MIRIFYQIDCDRLIIGTASGNTRDARAFVEAQIERYCDVPKKAHYRLKKAPGLGFHFEIQEGSKTGSIIDKVIDGLNDEDTGELLVFDANEVQYQVYRRPDGSLRTFIRSDTERKMPEGEESIKLLDGSFAYFRPYFSSLNLAAQVFGVIFAICFMVMLAFLTVSTTEGLIERGYKDAATHAPLALFQTMPGPPAMYESERTERLPAMGGLDAINRFKMESDEQIGRLVFDGVSWKAIPIEMREESKVPAKDMP